ncbi:MAG: hypothetical protein COS84_00850 [Armatimonadetes bacterium CG07_land_8_20_14_0_80_40_9]|nr:MAG: hypothetical protein COS84_00850 [Armatimonadetes bacterium CG07_land_8_20_14_0_80_40_9]
MDCNNHYGVHKTKEMRQGFFERKMKRIILPIICLIIFWSNNANAEIEIVYPTSLEKGVHLAIKDLTDYLKKMGEKNVREIQSDQYLFGREEEEKTIIFIQHPKGENIIGKRTLKQIGYDGFAIKDKKTRNKRIIALWGNNLRGIQYAIYDLLEKLGVRFFHPEQEFIPNYLKFPESLNKVENPAFKYRGYNLHTTHPLELINSFSNCKDDINYAKRWIDWIVKNKANYFTGGPRSGWIHEDCYQKRGAEINKYIEARGLLKTSGIAFGNYQQGGTFREVESETGLRTKESIIKELEEKLGDKSKKYDLFGIHFGTTEFTTTDDIATVELFNTVARWMTENRPDIPVFINSHTTGGQITPHYKVEYYDLVQFAPTILGIQVHTMFFYDLIGPAPYYGNKDVKYKHEMMVREAEKGRELLYYPESAWWLSFDNDIPIYLPIYLKTRDNDIQLLKPLLKKTLQGHKTFTTGQEWGYWQTDWCIAKMQWEVNFRWTNCIDEITAPLGKAKDVVSNIIKEMALDQEQEFIYKNRYKYLSGEDEIDEIGALAGITGHPLRIPFSHITKWSKDKIQNFQKQELEPLREMRERYNKWFQELKIVKSEIPQDNRWIFDEIYDGVEIDLLRIEHIINLYESVLNFRESIIENKDTKVAMKFYKKAEEITDKAKEVIKRREKNYRYPAEWSYGGGLTTETGVNNGTVYPYRVYTKTHLAFYWTRRNQQAKEVLKGKKEVVPVKPLFPLRGEKVNVNVRSFKGEEIEVQIGENPPTSKKEFSFQPPSHPVNIYFLINNIPSAQWTVIPLQKLYTLPPEGLKIIKPTNPMVSSIVEKIFPDLLAGISAEGKELVLSLDEDDDKDADSTEFTRFKDARKVEDGWEAGPEVLTIYLSNPATGEKVSAVRILNLFITIKDKEAENIEVVISGGLSTNDVVQAVIELGGMDEKGTRGLIANLLGIPSDLLPDALPFEAKFKAKSVTR